MPPVRTLVLLAALAAPMPLAPVAAQSPSAIAATTAGSGSGIRVIVSRRAAHVVFPVDAALARGWSQPRWERFTWGFAVDGLLGPEVPMIGVYGWTSDSAREFRSLAEIVALANDRSCRGEHPSCHARGVHARVQRGRVVLVIDDPARVRELFGLRPPKIRAWWMRPGLEWDLGRDSVRVEYVAPRLPPPDSAMRAQARREAWRHAAGISSTSRYLQTGAPRVDSTAFVVAGDSLWLVVRETACMYHTCHDPDRELHADAWTSGDTAVARVRPLSMPREDPAVRRVAGTWRRVRAAHPRAMVYAGRPGRTTVEVRGLRGDSDTLPARQPPLGTLRLQLIVTPPVRSLRILPRPDSVLAGDSLAFSVEAESVDGTPIDGLPMHALVPMGSHLQEYDTPRPNIRFAVPGDVVLTTRLGSAVDTLRVRVVPR